MSIRSFDIIIGMDRRSPHCIQFFCYTKVVSIILPNGETLTIYSDKSSQNLKLVSCIKPRKYLHKKYYTFLAHIVDKKSEVKEIKDITKVCDYPDVFP